jgi:hypothetical protein
MKNKRLGNGGNSSRDPLGNLVAQQAYLKNIGSSTKFCSGFLHFDLAEIPITQFRQAKNSASGLQARCDVCNRLYFSIIQKPKVRALAIAIWAESTSKYNWRDECPNDLHAGIELALSHWLTSPCLAGNDCRAEGDHGDFRASIEVLTGAWKGLERKEKTSSVLDPRNGLAYAAPQFMSDMQEFASSEFGALNKIDTQKVWEWWSMLKFPHDTAECSAERSAVKNGKMNPPVPAHLLREFPWGSGNILQTIEGHTVPGFNQVKSTFRSFKTGQASSGRVYEYLVQGDRKKMAAFSQECKAKGLTLGHTPAPLRWLGKHDVVNAVAETFDENIPKRDSLEELFTVASNNPVGARDFVSWQVADLVEQLGGSAKTVEEFTQRLQAGVEEYLNRLADAVHSGDVEIVLQDLERAEPGLPDSSYAYRLSKVTKWLTARPGYSQS